MFKPGLVLYPAFGTRLHRIKNRQAKRRCAVLIGLVAPSALFVWKNDMISVQGWMTFLQSLNQLAAFPLLLGGLALMLLGWRLWKVCVVVAYGFIGASIGWWLARQYGGIENANVLYSATGAILLGGLSFWPVKLAIAGLGGLIGGGVLMQILSSIGLSRVPLCIASTVGFAGFGALSGLYRRHVVIGVTAFIGACVFVSGGTVLLSTMRDVYGTYRQMALNSSLVIPFVLLVPTVMSCFFQVAEVRRHRIEL